MLSKKLKYERRAGKKDSKFFGIFLAFSMLLTSGAALCVSYFALHEEIPALYKSVLSRSWSKTDGKIVKTYTSTKSVLVGSSKNLRPATVYVPNVNYSFQVGNETFTGGRINYASAAKYFSLQEESREYLDSVYQINKNVEVFYDPHNPQESTLSREYVYKFGDYQAGCCCGSIGILFSLLFWFSIKDLIRIFRKQKK